MRTLHVKAVVEKPIGVWTHRVYLEEELPGYFVAMTADEAAQWKPGDVFDREAMRAKWAANRQASE